MTELDRAPWGDLPIGTIFHSAGRTVSEGEFALLVDLTWMTSPEHSDRQHAVGVGQAERTLPGPLLIAVAAGLSATSGFRHMLAAHGLRNVSMLSLEKIRFLGPVYPGDTLAVDSDIREVRAASRGNRAVMRVREVVSNQVGTHVCEFERVILIEPDATQGVGGTSSDVQPRSASSTDPS